MTKPTVTFLSYNSTGINTVKSSWICDLIAVTDASYVQIQEHFKSSKSTDKFFADQFPGYNSFVIPGHREKNQDSGRAKGGLAQLSKANLDVKKIRVKSSNFRIQAQVLQFTGTRILWMNAYFPTDPQVINYDETELQQILTEVENIMDSVDFDEVIFGADFNWDKSRKTGFVSCIDRWVTKVGLLDVWDNFPADYTHIHTDFKSLSTLDRFLVSPGILQHVVAAGPLHLGDNPSRHSPIMLKMTVDSLSTVNNKSRCPAPPRRPAWYKADAAQINTYTYRLGEKLIELEAPVDLHCQYPHCNSAGHLQSRDSFLLDILIAMIETSHETIPMGGVKKKKWDCKRNCEVGAAIPGWKEDLEPLRQESLFWHALWQQGGKPNKGHVFEIMKSVRNKYHYAVRKAKKLADSVRAELLFQQALLGDTNLLQEMKRIKGDKNYRTTTPDHIDTANGPEEISELFKGVYKDLFNSAESNQGMQVLQDQLRDVIRPQSLLEVNKITGAAVKDACSRMKAR